MVPIDAVGRPAVVLLVLVLAAGAVAAGPTAAPASTADAQTAGSVEYEIAVTADGEIDRGTIVWTTTDELYGELLATAQDAGYDSVAEYWADGLAAPEPGLGGVEAEDRQTEAGYELHMTFTEIDADSYRLMNASREDGEIRWERPALDGGLSDPAFEELTYRVVMPGEVTDTNAQEVEGDVAIWHLNEADPGRLYAVSEPPADDDPVPGFGLVVAGAGLLLGLVVERRSG